MIRPRLAVAAGAAVLAIAGCGGSSDGEVKPFLVSFVPGSGDVVSVNMRRANEVYVEDRFFAGVEFDVFAAAPPRTDSLAIDSETGTVALVDLTSLSGMFLSAATPAAVSFEAVGAVASETGAFFLVHDDAGATLAAVNASERSSLVLSAEATLEGGAAELTADPLGAFVLLTRNGTGTIGVFDFGAPDSPLRIESIPGAGPIRSASFVPYSADVVAALDATGSALVLLALSGARTGGPIEGSSLSLPFDADDPPVSWAAFHAAPRLVVASSRGRLAVVEATDPLAPVVLTVAESGVGSATLDVVMSPDDSLLAVASPDAGTLRFFSLAASGDPTIVGAFELGFALDPMGFAPEGDAASFSDRPLFFAGVGGAELVLADLSLGVGAVLLSPPAAFTPLSTPAVYDTKRGPVLVGLDAEGRVIRFGLYDPNSGPELITSADLGLGADAEGVFVYRRKS